MTATIAVLAAILTFGWIVVSSVRHIRRERAAVECQVGSIVLEQRIKECSVAEVEGRVMGSMREISDIVARRAPTKMRERMAPEMTPRDLRAVDPLGDETRTMMAIRVKAEDIGRMVKSKRSKF